MTTTSIENNEDLRNTVEQLQNLIDSLIELGVLVHDNQGTQQTHQVLIHKFNQLVNQLSSLSESDLKEYPIPIDIISYIEDGRNPDIYTREFVEVNAKSNARLKGKMKNFGKLRDILGQKLEYEYPELKEDLDVIKERTS